MKIMMFGSGQFPLPLFERLVHLQKLKPEIVQSIVLSTTSDSSLSKKLHKNMIYQYAKENNIATYTPIQNKMEVLKQWNAFSETDIFKKQEVDFGLVCNFGYMIPSKLIDHFKKGLIVIHPSLLPKYRGAAPIQRALMNGEGQTGVSFIEISKQRFDAGSILLQQHVKIDPSWRYKELSEQLSLLCQKEMLNLLTNLNEFRRQALVQDESQVTKAPKIQHKETIANFKDNDSITFLNIYRGIYGTLQNTLKTKFEDKVIYLEEVSLPSYEELGHLSIYINANPESIWIINNKRFRKYIYVKCKDGWIKISQFRFIDRSLIQGSFTFIDQFLVKDEIFGNPESNGKYYFTSLIT